MSRGFRRRSKRKTHNAHRTILPGLSRDQRRKLRFETLEDRRMLTVTFDWATIGNPGNTGELSGAGAGGYGPDATVGGVGYSYSIAKHEVTNAQYMEFLNAVAATDPNGLYSPNMGGTTQGGIVRSGPSGSYTYGVKPDAVGQGPGGTDYTYANKPVVYVSFFDAMRFTNWLENGQPMGPQGPGTTEEGVYAISDGLSEMRAADATYFIPSEDEWYKAAYHKNDGVTNNYYDYATSSDSVPNNNIPSSDTGNSANFYQGDYTNGNSSYPLTDVGAYMLSGSPYGTFDQAGSVWEWNEARVLGLARGVRGGAWGTDSFSLQSSDRSHTNTTNEYDVVGLRVASAEVITPSVSVITHGWQPIGGDGSPPPDWTLEMGIAILERADGPGNIFVHNTDSGESTFGDWIPLNDLGDPDYTWANSNNASDELVLVYNWVWDSNDGEDGWLQAAADNLFASLLAAPLGIGLSMLNGPLHFIGHSRGAVVNSLTTNLLGHHFDSFTVDQVTTLDPHPIATGGSIVGVVYEEDDPAIYTYENVRFADNYYREFGNYQIELDLPIIDFDGVSVSGARNIELSNPVLVGTAIEFLDGGHVDGILSRGEHSDVHLWYTATIAKDEPIIETLPVTEEETAGWWTAGTGYSAAQEPGSGRDNVGYARSRVGGADRSNFAVTSGQAIVGSSQYVFNGDFEVGDHNNSDLGLADEIPGWERHGGAVDADLTADGRLHLGEFLLANYESITHNPLYFPEGTIGLSFDYEITDDSLDDQLVVYVGATSVGLISLNTVRIDTADILLDSSYQGIVDTITFELSSGGSINSDVYIDNVDLVLAAPTLNADFNTSGLVTGADFLAWQRGYGTVFGASLADGDADGDQDVDGNDLNVWEAQYGSEQGINAALIVHYKLDAITGPVIDSAGSFNGTNVNDGATRGVAGKIDSAFQFDGVNDYVSTPFGDGVSYPDGITIQAWVKSTDTGDGGLVLSRGPGSGSTSEFLGLNAGLQQGIPGMNLYTGSSPYHTVEANTSINDNQWHHVLGTYDGSNLSIYVDGVGVSQPVTGIAESTADFKVGLDDVGLVPDRLFKGKIDDVRIWDRALSAAEVVTLATEVSPLRTSNPIQMAPSETATLPAQPLSAEMVDAAMVVDFASRSKSESRPASTSLLEEDQIDWLSRSTGWSQEPAWQGRSEIASHSLRGQTNTVNDDRFSSVVLDDAVNEELLDELFAEGALDSML